MPFIGGFGRGFGANGPIDAMSGIMAAALDNALAPRPHAGMTNMYRRRRGSGLRDILGGLGDGLANLGGMQGVYARTVADRERMALLAEEQQQKIAQLQAIGAAIAADPNLSPQEKAYAGFNPEEFTKRYSERFGTFDVGEGDTLVSGMGGGRRDTFTAPKVTEVGSDLVLSDPSGAFGNRAPSFGLNSRDLDPNTSADGLPLAQPRGAPPMAQTIYSGRLDTERYADSLGLQRGSADWLKAVRDFALKEYGPTAIGAKRELREMENRQSDINNQRTTDASRFNRANTPVATMTNERGEVVTAYPTGRVTTFRNSRPGSGGGGGRGRQGGAGRAAAEGTVIRNPQTGQKLVRRNGQWVPLR